MQALRTMLAAGALAASLADAVAATPPAVLAVPADLRADARLAGKGGQPLVLLFSLPGCRYCDVVRQNYLAPLARAQREGGAMVVRELKLTDTAAIKGFAGEKTSGRALGAHYGVQVAPTVLMLGPDGKLLAAPLPGGDVSGMYSAYLDNALQEARAAMPRAATARHSH